MPKALNIAGRKMIGGVDLFAMSSFITRRVDLIGWNPPRGNGPPLSPAEYARRAAAAFLPLGRDLARDEVSVFPGVNWVIGTSCDARLQPRASARGFSVGPRRPRRGA